ncbi:50S ribosomal protein L10 [Candidatus Marinimicrobia bacterium]|jgi:large subunit ribosomal protein L10|nr:50S ribosomal protein L10 [Candidatus Neomarinimicrobiota bacterium]MDC0654176.1 50S ribosomal protein L10 [Candidatus Neomarinimicrobiota bacterium]MDC3287357.1 50S ribosomal protein L10 [Candidatus Neomarinimicrobiota bacterium]|tara:strand:- start:21447 stop:21965 length:519 start_codon:yes stop_codon:yes gene_type:complete
MPSTKNVDAVKVLSDKLEKAKAVYFTDYLGLDVVSITQLRKEFVMKDVEFTIAKNTLIKLAAKEAGMSGIDDFLKGPTAMAVSYEDPTNPAQVIKDFLKDFDKPSVKGMILDGEVFDANEFERIANLPSKDQLLSKLVGMLNSPMAKLSSTLGSPVSGLLGALEQLNSKKEG